MMRRGLAVLAWGLLGVGLYSAAAPAAHAQDANIYYHYPFYYFPHNYWPNYVQWPDHRRPFAPPPAYMAYPPYLDQNFRYELWTRMRYYRGNHFWLDQF
jgi:hypothetical protein